MNRISKFATGAAGAAVLAVSAATPAQARDHGNGIDAGEAITGVAVLGGIAAIAAAMDRDGNRYGYRYRYRGGYQAAVNACAYRAERYGRGRVRILDVDRRGNNRYRVRGVIHRDHRYGWGNDRRWGRDSRLAFRCTARTNGRITDFDVNRFR